VNENYKPNLHYQIHVIGAHTIVQEECGYLIMFAILHRLYRPPKIGTLLGSFCQSLVIDSIVFNRILVKFYTHTRCLRNL